MALTMTDLPLFDGCSVSEKALLSTNVRTLSYRRGELIHSHCNDCIGILLVTSGHIAVSVMSGDGREATLFRLSRGDFCVLSLACIFRRVDSEIHFEAETDLTLERISDATLRRLISERPSLEAALHRATESLFSRVILAMQRMLFDSIEKRVATYLCEETARSRAATLYATHEQIAKYIGSAREVVTRTLRRLANAGLVKLGHGYIGILDRDALVKLTE